MSYKNLTAFTNLYKSLRLSRDSFAGNDSKVVFTAYSKDSEGHRMSFVRRFMFIHEDENWPNAINQLQLLDVLCGNIRSLVCHGWKHK